MSSLFVEAANFDDPGVLEPNDVPQNASDTRQGSDHGPLYQSIGAIGDGTNGAADVDFYEVELSSGDRLTVDVDTLIDGPDTYLRIFDSNGIEVLNNSFDAAPTHLNGILPNPLDPDVPLPDPDDPATLRTVDPFVDFTATASGTYFVAVSSQGNETYDPLTVSGRVEGQGGTGLYGISVEVYAPRNFVFNFNGGGKTTDFSALIGTTITVTHTSDIVDSPDTPPDRNTTVYEFVADDGNDPPEQPVNPDNVPIRLLTSADSRQPDILRTISGTFTNPDRDFATDAEVIEAAALGGELANGPGIITFSWQNRDVQGFGHDPDPDAQIPSPVRATTETFVFVRGVADLTISDEALAAGLHYGPYVGSDAHGGIPEAGLVTTNGTSATVMNNIFANLDQSIVRDHVDFEVWGDGGPHPKPADVFISFNISQDHTNPSIIQGDFNELLDGTQPLFANADGNNFLPDPASFAIDSANNFAEDRDNIRELRESIGLPNSNLLAPDRDVNGVLRADNPNVGSQGGLGDEIFKDRGSNELADFVGPVAIANQPLDNDALGIDRDAANSVIQLASGTLDEFRIQLRDTGDSSDPFAGLGIDDNTVVVSNIDGLRLPGSNVTLFRDEQLLVEGVDYAFSYDETQNVVTLTPLAGTWESDRAYRIQLNNRSRTVLIAPDASEVADGDQLVVTDDAGGIVTLEFESGISLLVPEALTLVVPQIGTNTGGLRDGDLFEVNDGSNDPVVFEFNLPGDAKLPDSIEVTLPEQATPSSEPELQAFLELIAGNIATAIQGEVDAGRLDVDVRQQGSHVIIGAEAGARAFTSLTALEQLPRTLALEVPSTGVGPTGIQDGDTFDITAAGATITFEFNTNGLLSDSTHFPIAVDPDASAEEIAIAIRRAIENSAFSFIPTVEDDRRTVYLNLPQNGSVVVPSGQLTVTGVSRSLTDGDTIVITGTDGTETAFEFDAASDGVLGTNVEIDVSRVDTADEIAARIVNAIQAQSIEGLNPTDLEIVEGGLVSIGGETGLAVVASGDSMEVIGMPSVTTSSTIAFTGQVQDGEILIIREGNEEVSFEFQASVGGGSIGQGNVPVIFQPGGSTTDVAASLASAINNNSGALNISAVADEGVVTLHDRPVTMIDVTLAPTLTVGGVPGGAIPVLISPAFTAVEVKRALIDAINAINQPGEDPITPLSAEDRGGATLFVSGGVTFSGPVDAFTLPAISDVAGNPLEANRSDLTTQFTILMPTVGLDFGDAPDPVQQVQGRYPTKLVNDGPRHVIDDQLFLGLFSDADLDGMPSVGADGDDLNLQASETGDLFAISLVNGNAEIEVQDIDAVGRDGDTITISTGITSATLEFDVDGRFDEDNFAIRPADLNSRESIAAAIGEAIEESPLQIAGFTVSDQTAIVVGDDEDGVSFSSESNPEGVLNESIALPIDVTVTGAGIVEAWIDFNADGDWTDPGEQIIPMDTSPAFMDLRDQLCPANLTGRGVKHLFRFG